MTPRSKRGQHVPPPPAEGQWALKYAIKESLAFAELERQFPGNCDELKERLRTNPDVRSEVQKPLKGALGTRMIGGLAMPQWQYDISSGVRLWYCIDEATRTAWFTLAAPGHPQATLAKSKRAPRNR